MKTKIIGIIICSMLMTTLLTTAQNVEKTSFVIESDEFDRISSDEVGVPVWEVGNKFVYKINNITIDFEENNYSLNLNVKTENLPLEVIDDSGDFYNLSFKIIISGFFEIGFKLEMGDVNISFEFVSVTCEGYLLVRKADIALKEIYAEISGDYVIKIINQPFIDMNFDLQKEIDALIKFNIEFENARQPIVKWPFIQGELWGLPSENFTLNLCIIESSYFDKIDRINRKLVNPILDWINRTFNGPKISDLLEFSNILLDILPKVDICHILNEYTGTGCNFTSPEIPELICCLPYKDWITVPAGTFECYNISILGTNANIYYNETVESIVKIIGNFQTILPSVSDIDIELIDYEKA